jgi:hypothetical protein
VSWQQLPRSIGLRAVQAAVVTDELTPSK